MYHFLMFSAHFDRDKGLDQGRLRLCSIGANGPQSHKIWIAATSTAGKQQPEGFHKRNHMLPPEYRIPGLPAWTVHTRPIALPHVPGVQGNFYKLTPFEVTTDQGGKRGDFGVHWDGNTPGSAGCIVMSKRRFDIFQEEMEKLEEQDIFEIPLFVTYS
ncbi:MAG: hypothetical protein QNJ36_09035 [Calothrix sp. MO_167.B42]|nr:hypothetical protein [Calothrix sp. MO_167.B42]